MELLSSLLLLSCYGPPYRSHSQLCGQYYFCGRGDDDGSGGNDNYYYQKQEKNFSFSRCCFFILPLMIFARPAVPRNFGNCRGNNGLRCGGCGG